MGYVGNEPDVGFTSFAQQTITGNGGTSYTLSHAVANGKEILLYINNIKQEEGSSKAYTASGTTLTLSEAISSSDSCYCVFLGKALQTTVAPDGSVTSAKLANANLEMPNTLDMNGNELILDADGDTSIEASTDDTIVFDTGGSEAMRITADKDVLIAKTAEGVGTAGFEVQNTGKALITVDGARCLDLNRLTDVGQVFVVKTGGNQRIALGGSGGAGFIDGASGDTGLKFEGLHIRPRDNGSDVDNSVDLGNGSFRFDDIHATNGTIQTSDQNEKNTITDSDLGLDFVNRLAPKSYIFNGKTRTHYGLIAQDVETVLSDINKETSEFAGFIKSDISEEQDGSQYRYGLRYTEFVGILIKALQEADDKIDALTARVTALEGN